MKMDHDALPDDDLHLMAIDQEPEHARYALYDDFLHLHAESDFRPNVSLVQYPCQLKAVDHEWEHFSGESSDIHQVCQFLFCNVGKAIPVALSGLCSDLHYSDQ